MSQFRGSYSLLQMVVVMCRALRTFVVVQTDFALYTDVASILLAYFTPSLRRRSLVMAKSIKTLHLGAWLSFHLATELLELWFALEGR